MKCLFTISALLLFSCASAQTPALVWAKNMGSSGSNYTSVAVDASGNVYTTGFFEGTADFDPGPNVYNLSHPNNEATFISKLDASGNFVWAKALGGSEGDQGISIALDEAGNVFVTGYFYGMTDFDPGPGMHNLTSAGGADIFVCKLNAAGDLVWARQMGGDDEDIVTSIAVDAFGNVYTTGFFFETADFDPGPGVYNLTRPYKGGLVSMFISKLDASGNFVWAKQLGNDDATTIGRAIQVDRSGNVYTTGVFLGTSDFDPGAGIYNLGSYEYDILISKLDASGNFVWAKNMGGVHSDEGDAITIDDGGNVYTTGSFTGTADFDPGPGTHNLTASGSRFDPDIFVSKLNASGNFVWAKNMGGPLPDYGLSIATDAAGNVYTTGSFQDTADFNPGSDSFNLKGSFGQNDVFISRLDSSGNFVFAGDVGRGASGGEAIGQSLVLDAPGNIYITGKFSGIVNFSLSPDKDMYLNSETGSIFVVKLNQVPYCTTYYRDVDGDGFGNPSDSISGCTQPPGYTTNNKDCNDNDNTIHAPVTYYRDIDHDGFGDPDHSICACSNTPPAGYVKNNLDCYDGDAAGSDTIAIVMVPGTSNSWLAGMPDGTQAQFGDVAHANSPVLATIKLTGTSWIEVTKATGGVWNESSSFTVGPEGGDILGHNGGAEHGKSGLTAPINSLIAVFLNDQVPTNPVPQPLDFSTQSSRNYLNLYPKLQQVFFIGDGITGEGTGQKIFIPKGATRLYLGTMDGYEWNNNIGAFCVTVKVMGNSSVSDWYIDADGDGYGNPAFRLDASAQPAGYVADNTDCNDNNKAIHAPVTYYRDLDRDGYGDSYNSISVCSNVPPPGYVTTNYDCYDSGTVSHPEYVRVRMCHDGWTQCVNLKDIPEKLSLGWTLGLCPLQSCAADETLMCHNGKQECIKTKDVAGLLARADGKWWQGPTCGGTHISGNTSVKTANAARHGKVQSMPAIFKITNYPNPFEGTTTISYEIPVDCKVSIKVYDLVGRALTTLVDEYKKAGIYTVNVHADRLSSGTLFYRIIARSKDHQFQQTNQMIKIK